MCLGGALEELGDAGHDVQWAGAWAEDPGDEEILSLAWQEETNHEAENRT